MFFLVALLLAQAPAWAHPHIFIDAKVGFAFDEAGQIEGLRVAWTYDEFTTLLLFDLLDLDPDGDGALTREDHEALFRGELSWEDGYVGDLYLQVDEGIRPHLLPVNPTAAYENDAITLAFDLPLREPLQPGGKEIILRVYDPYYYFSYTVAEMIPSERMPEGCGTSLFPFKPDTATQELQALLSRLSMDQMPEQENVGRLFADEVVLQCD